MKTEFLYIVVLITLKNAVRHNITATKRKHQNKILTEIMAFFEEDTGLNISGNSIKILYAITHFGNYKLLFPIYLVLIIYLLTLKER